MKLPKNKYNKADDGLVTNADINTEYNRHNNKTHSQYTYSCL